jgi:hypothetical protein
MTRFISWLLACTRLMIGTEASKAAPTTGIAEECRVYRAVIERSYGLANRKLVIVDRTATGLFRSTRPVGKLEYVRENFGGMLEPETLDDYRAKNRRYHRLNPNLALGVPYVLVSEGQIAKIFKQSRGWDRFYNIYPNSNGILTFSRVGFNAQTNQALVYHGSQTHYLAGVGRYVLLTKKEDIWTVDNTVETWVS